MGRLPWTLRDFPQGYILLLHMTPRKTRKPRRDFFLYGACPVLTILAIFIAIPAVRSRVHT